MDRINYIKDLILRKDSTLIDVLFHIMEYKKSNMDLEQYNRYLYSEEVEIFDKLCSINIIEHKKIYGEDTRVDIKLILHLEDIDKFYQLNCGYSSYSGYTFPKNIEDTIYEVMPYETIVMNYKKL